MNFLMWFGNTTILLMAAVMGIDLSLFEAAEIDGATPSQIFWKITMPLIRPILVYVMITSLIGGLQMFDVPQILTNGKGNPDRCATTMIMYLNNHMFSKNYGMAGAISVILFIICAVLCVVIYRSTNEDEGEEKEMTTQAVRDKGAEHSRHELLARRIVSYVVLAILCFLCLFFFYVLIINATRNHYQIQRGFSFLPGKSFTTNLKNVLADANIPITFEDIKNSLVRRRLSAILSIYFSALTAYGVHAYDFKLEKIASAFIILIMTMPTQVSALGFLRLMTNMKLTDTLIPLFLPERFAAPTVYYFMVSYMKSNLPMEIVEAARVDGSGEFHTFNHVVLPIMKPALAVQAIFTFVASWNNYFVPALILTSNKKKDPPDFDRSAPQRGLP